MRARHAKRPASRPAARGAWHGAAALLLLAALCAAGARAQTVDANGNPVGSGGRRGRLGVERNLPAQIGASVMLLGKFDWEIGARRGRAGRRRLRQTGAVGAGRPAGRRAPRRAGRRAGGRAGAPAHWRRAGAAAAPGGARRRRRQRVAPPAGDRRRHHFPTVPPAPRAPPADAVATANTGKPWSRCLDQLWRAAQRTNSTNINFVPTHHWLPPQYQRGVAAGVGQYCTMSGTNGANTCQSWSPELIVEFREAMTICFAEAFRMGLTISVRPHLVRAPGGAAGRGGRVRAGPKVGQARRRRRRPRPHPAPAHTPCAPPAPPRTTRLPRRAGATASRSSRPSPTPATPTRRSCWSRWRRRTPLPGPPAFRQ